MKHYLILIVFVLPLSLISQNHDEKSWCHLNCEYTQKDRETAELLHLRMKDDSIKGGIGENVKFPLRFGFVQEDKSTTPISEEVLREVVNHLNSSFSSTGFVFYLDRIDIIESVLKLEDLSRNAFNIYDKFSTEHDLKDMLTVYVLDHKNEFCDITPSSISCAKTGGFSYILSDRTTNVVMSKFDLRDPKIIAHEFGHFFGLFHTFEESVFGKDTFNVQSCALTGDRICDTPPDPGATFEVYVNYSLCEMLGYKDANGNEYKPLLANFMSYYKPCYLKKHSFTEQQELAMRLASRLEIRSKLSR